MRALTVIVASSVLCISAVILSFIQTVQDEPYMDEIFHIPQAQQFCSKNFSHWDPMITTLPGLYISSLIILFPFSLILEGQELPSLCTTYNLRAGNVLYCIGNFILLFLLSKVIHHKSQSGKTATPNQLLLNATTLTLFPVSYFFSWLYYTDPGSVLFTLLMYLLCLRERHGLAAVSGAASILFRQTNVIWVLFCFVLCASNVLEVRINQNDNDKNKYKQRKMMNRTDWDELKFLFKFVFSSGSNFFTIVKDVFVCGIYYIFILVCFAAFVFVNNGVVVGDRSNHQASLNFPQVFYFLVVSAAFIFIHIIHPEHIFTCMKSVVKNLLKSIAFVVVAYLLIKHYTYEHKYTLSDNRHYTFYVWSKIFKRFQWARYAMIPIYLFCSVSFYHLLSHKGLIWRCIYLLSILVCLVPQALLEFRYYIIPFLILRLNMSLPGVKALLVELLVYVAINVFTVLMFLQKPFYWPHDPNPQRFMW